MYNFTGCRKMRLHVLLRTVPSFIFYEKADQIQMHLIPYKALQVSFDIGSFSFGDYKYLKIIFNLIRIRYRTILKNYLFCALLTSLHLLLLQFHT